MPLYDTNSPLKNERNLKDDLFLLAKKNPKKLINLLKYERSARLKAEELSEIDDITELLLNRRGWKKYAVDCTYNLAKDNLPFSVFFIDLDRLKAVDDLFTNQHGTVYIQLFAEVLHATLRPDDVKSHPQGDEFFVLLPNTLKKEAQILRDKVLRKFDLLVHTLPSDHFFYEVPHKCEVGACIGIADRKWGARERQEILMGSEEEIKNRLVHVVREVRIRANMDSMKIKKKKRVIREEAYARRRFSRIFPGFLYRNG
jgi:diguanylate cyclase (GGDEF)-like protein